MTVKELIKELEELPEYATVRVLKKDGENFYYRWEAKEVILQPHDDDDDYLERYVDIK